MKALISSFLIVLLVLSTQSCGENDISEIDIPNDNFDRGALLTDIADNVIIPGYINYTTDLANLDLMANNFSTNPDAETLFQLKLEFKNAYLSWQSVSMFEIGKAEALALRNNTNIYPTNTSEIEENISTGEYNLALPSKIDEQGFPALDYLLYGVADTEEEIVKYHSENEKARNYLTDLTSRLVSLTNEVKEDWVGDYRAYFIENDGSSATSSLNKLVNDYIFYYEKFLRAGKIGIPAGVFSGNPLPNTAEGLYSEEYSKTLFLQGLNAASDFFVGASTNHDEIGESLKSYLDYLDPDGNALSEKIITQFEEIKAKANELDDNFVTQIASDNTKMLETYDELQKNVILLKVDMLQALNIKVDFVDADGD